MRGGRAVTACGLFVLLACSLIPQYVTLKSYFIKSPSQVFLVSVLKQNVYACHACGAVSNGASKACEARGVDSRAPLALNVDPTQALFETPSHKGRRYISPNHSKLCPASSLVKRVK